MYEGTDTAGMKALIDQARDVLMVNGGLFQRKIGSAVIAVRSNGAIHMTDSPPQISGMIVAGFLPKVSGGQKGEGEKDKEGIAWARNAEKNIAWLLAQVRTENIVTKKRKGR